MFPEHGRCHKAYSCNLVCGLVYFKRDHQAEQAKRSTGHNVVEHRECETKYRLALERHVAVEERRVRESHEEEE